MRWLRGAAGAVALAGVSACSSAEVVPEARPRPEREKGSFIARALAERAPRPRPPEPSVAPAASFKTPFGQSIPLLPFRDPESSIGGRELHYWVVGAGPQNVLLLGGIHGDERSSSDAAYDFLLHVLRHPELVAGRRLVVAPEVNPDGIAAGTRRNQRGVDVNRNFPAENWCADDAITRHAPGLRPGSEPETRFVLSLLHRFPPSVVVSAHAAAACVNWDGPAEGLARSMSRECGLPAKESVGYPTPGSLGSLLGIDRAIPTITLELDRKDSIEGARDGVRRALLAALRSSDSRPVPSR